MDSDTLGTRYDYVNHACCSLSIDSHTEQGYVQQGSSGSPVLDLTKNGMYGYVTGLNSFGELHVVPISAALDQIWNMVQSAATLHHKPRIYTVNSLVPMKNRYTEVSVVQDLLLQCWQDEMPVSSDAGINQPALSDVCKPIAMGEDAAKTLNREFPEWEIDDPVYVNDHPGYRSEKKNLRVATRYKNNDGRWVYSAKHEDGTGYHSGRSWIEETDIRRR